MYKNEIGRLSLNPIRSAQHLDYVAKAINWLKLNYATYKESSTSHVRCILIESDYEAYVVFIQRLSPHTALKVANLVEDSILTALQSLGIDMSKP